MKLLTSYLSLALVEAFMGLVWRLVSGNSIDPVTRKMARQPGSLSAFSLYFTLRAVQAEIRKGRLQGLTDPTIKYIGFFTTLLGMLQWHDIITHSLILLFCCCHIYLNKICQVMPTLKCTEHECLAAAAVPSDRHRVVRIGIGLGQGQEDKTGNEVAEMNKRKKFSLT